MPDPVTVGASVALAVVVYLVGYGQGRQNGREASTNNSRPTLDRGSEWVTVIGEDQDGYGTAVRELSIGLEVVSFDGENRIYEETWVPPDHLEPLAEVLSVLPHEKTGDGKTATGGEENA